jgi:hypothetical protein
MLVLVINCTLFQVFFRGDPLLASLPKKMVFLPYPYFRSVYLVETTSCDGDGGWLKKCGNKIESLGKLDNRKTWCLHAGITPIQGLAWNRMGGLEIAVLV